MKSTTLPLRGKSYPVRTFIRHIYPVWAVYRIAQPQEMNVAVPVSSHQMRPLVLLV